MTDASISAVTGVIPGGTYTLLGDLVAFNRLERHYGKPWFVVLDEARKNMRIDDVAVMFSVFARSGGAPDTFTPDEAVKQIGDMRSFGEAMKRVQACIDAALPPRSDNEGGGGNAPSDPPA